MFKAHRDAYKRDFSALVVSILPNICFDEIRVSENVQQNFVTIYSSQRLAKYKNSTPERWDMIQKLQKLGFRVEYTKDCFATIKIFQKVAHERYKVTI